LKSCWVDSNASACRKDGSLAATIGPLDCEIAAGDVAGRTGQTFARVRCEGR
jgi:hypothetical protein